MGLVNGLPKGVVKANKKLLDNKFFCHKVSGEVSSHQNVLNFKNVLIRSEGEGESIFQKFLKYKSVWFILVTSFYLQCSFDENLEA